MIPGKGLSGFYGLGEIGPCVRAGAEESGGSEEQTEIMGFTSIYVLFYAPTNGSEAGGLSTNTIEWTSDTFVNYSERKIESLQRVQSIVTSLVYGGGSNGGPSGDESGGDDDDDDDWGFASVRNALAAVVASVTSGEPSEESTASAELEQMSHI